MRKHLFLSDIFIADSYLAVIHRNLSPVVPSGSGPWDPGGLLSVMAGRRGKGDGK